MTVRESILSRIPKGDSVLPEPYINPVPEAIDLWLQFRTRLEALGGRWVEVENLKEELHGSVFADQDLRLHPALNGCTFADDLWKSDAGVTRANLAISETGSLLLESGPTKHRLASLAPPRHIVLVSRIVRTLDEALATMDRSRNGVVITGPSRTADITGILVRGIHGPKELIVVQVNDSH
jgi:L-lactate utilization protein LutC